METPANAMDFSNVLVFDSLVTALFLGAEREGLTTGASEPGPTMNRLRGEYQHILSLLVLFDQVLVSEVVTSPRKIPLLEDAGIIRRIERRNPIGGPKPLVSNWCHSGTLPPPLLKSLALVQEYRPIVIEYLMRHGFHEDVELARLLGISRRRYYGELLEYVIAYVQGDRKRLRDSSFPTRLPRESLDFISRRIFRFGSGDQKLFNVTLIEALVCVSLLQVAQDLSSELRVGVASREFCAISDRTGLISLGESSAISGSFAVVQSVIREEQPFFPQIQTLRDVMRLRKDPRLELFRRKLADFHATVGAGDANAAARLRTEVRTAISRMAKTRSWERRLRWVTYLSLPAGVIESLTCGLPILSTTLGIVSAVGTGLSHANVRTSEWVLFGS